MENNKPISRETSLAKVESTGDGFNVVLKNSRPYKAFRVSFAQMAELISLVAQVSDDIAAVQAEEKQLKFVPVSLQEQHRGG